MNVRDLLKSSGLLTEKTEYSAAQQQLLADDLLAAVEKHTEKWQDDPKMTDQMIAGVLMTAATMFGGDMLAMVSRAMDKRDELEAGADLFRNGALAAAQIVMRMMDEEDKMARH